jgi:hypothetical protein
MCKLCHLDGNNSSYCIEEISGIDMYFVLDKFNCMAINGLINVKLFANVLK